MVPFEELITVKAAFPCSVRWFVALFSFKACLIAHKVLSCQSQDGVQSDPARFHPIKRIFKRGFSVIVVEPACLLHTFIRLGCVLYIILKVVFLSVPAA